MSRIAKSVGASMGIKLLSSYAIRRCLVADDGHAMLSSDFDQIELRIAAALAEEASLIDAAKRGESLHRAAAAKLYGPDYTPDQYRTTKGGNFGWLYGSGPATMAKTLGIPVPDAWQFITEYENSFPALKAYKRHQTESILRQALNGQEYKQYKALQHQMYSYRTDSYEGRAGRKALQLEIDRLLYRRHGWVTTPFGRRMIVDADKAYKATNYVVQATARDFMAQSWLDVMDDPELEPTVLLPIHDELLGQALIAKAEYIARRYGEVMSREFRGVPLDATGKVYGKSWGHGYRN